MRSKILVHIPSSFFIHASKKYPFKQIKELGFDQLVLDASHVINEEKIKDFLSSANLSLFGVYLDRNLSKQEVFVLMEVLHTLDCSFLLAHKILADEINNTIEESGL